MTRFIRQTALVPAIILVFVLLGVQAQSDNADENTDENTDNEAPAEEDAQPTQPLGMFLTWQRDPTTTMTIDWQMPIDAEASSTLAYKLVGADEWQTVEAEAVEFPFSDRAIFRRELTGLEPDTAYRFRTGDFERLFKFRTMPASIIDRPLVIASGGDTRHRQAHMERTNRAAMKYDPDFIVWGGDLAYADGLPQRVDRWYEWFDAIMNTMITDEGRVVPVVVCIGNHEVRGGYFFNVEGYDQTDEGRRQAAPYFYSLFAFPGQPGYGALDFGNYLSLLMLDTDHSNPVTGEQAEWLEAALAERQERRVTHVLPFYHVPAWPSHRRFGGRVETRVRDTFVPLFEQYGVRVAYEHHDHTYKRTWPIRGGEVDSSGITYIGDGAWGVGVREGNSSDEWYIKRFERRRHAIITTLHGTHQHFLMVDENGEVFDEFPQTPHTRNRRD
jgi:acid phosphatase type 7